MKKFKGLAHIHSNYSDGKYSLKKLKQMFKGKIQFIMINDHKEMMSNEKIKQMKNECKKISTSNFLAIPGIECKLNENVHLLISGLGKRRSEQLRTIVHINKEFLKKRFFNLKSIDCIEVWNRYNDGILPNSKSLQIFTKLKENYGNLHATGGLELHSSIQTDIIIEVLCEKLTEKQILTSIKRGHFISYSKNIILFPDGNITYLKNRNMLFVKNVIYLFLRKVAIFGRKLSWKPKPILKIYHKICGEK